MCPTERLVCRRLPKALTKIGLGFFACVAMNDAMPNRQPSASAPVPPRGSLTLILGCMFSGKTSELFRALTHFEPQSIRVFKHVIDNRYDPDSVVSHGGKAMPAVRIASAEEIPALIGGDISWVAIDEGHFFDRSLADVAESLTRRGVRILVTALDRDSWSKPFLVVDQLRLVADREILLFATCASCGARADRTQRTKPIVNGQMVGGPESYEPRCAPCWEPPVVSAAV